jgi:uncharacterized membrane protein YdcZ (DUF606 family)
MYLTGSTLLFFFAFQGFALFSAMLVTGQLICANAMDHFALLGLEKQV